MTWLLNFSYSTVKFWDMRNLKAQITQTCPDTKSASEQVCPDEAHEDKISYIFAERESKIRLTSLIHLVENIKILDLIILWSLKSS